MLSELKTAHELVVEGTTALRAELLQATGKQLEGEVCKIDQGFLELTKKINGMNIRLNGFVGGAMVLGGLKEEDIDFSTGPLSAIAIGGMEDQIIDEGIGGNPKNQQQVSPEYILAILNNPNREELIEVRRIRREYIKSQEEDRGKFLESELDSWYTLLCTQEAEIFNRDEPLSIDQTIDYRRKQNTAAARMCLAFMVKNSHRMDEDRFAGIASILGELSLVGQTIDDLRDVNFDWRGISGCNDYRPNIALAAMEQTGEINADGIRAVLNCDSTKFTTRQMRNLSPKALDIVENQVKCFVENIVGLAGIISGHDKKIISRAKTLGFLGELVFQLYPDIANIIYAINPNSPLTAF